MSADKAEATKTAADLVSAEHRRKPQFLDQPGMDGAISVLFRLAMEISVLRERLATHEALAEKSGAYSRADVESYVPDEASATEIQKAREAFVAGIMRDLGQN